MSSAAGIGVSDGRLALLDRQPSFGLSGRNQPSCPEPEASLGLNIVDFRVQLASTAGFEAPFVWGRRFAVDQSVQKARPLLETGGHLANVGLEVIDGDQNRRHGAKR